MPGLATVAVLVDDYDRAVDWYRRCLGFSIAQDVDQGNGKRFLTMTTDPKDGGGAQLLLAKAAGPAQIAAIGDQFGGRIGFFLEVDDFDARYAVMEAEGVEFLETPRDEVYGRVVQFRDLYGNGWDLIEPK